MTPLPRTVIDKRGRLEEQQAENPKFTFSSNEFEAASLLGFFEAWV